jgi:hypothetical protein
MRKLIAGTLTTIALLVVATPAAACPYSHATRGNIDVRLAANGAPVELEEPASG